MVREAVRVVVVDEHDAVLLLWHEAPHDRPHWAPPGGGIEPGETPHEAAERELREETGLTGLALGDPVRRWRHTFSFAGERIDQDETIFVARVRRGAVDSDPDVRAADGIRDARWMTRDELRACPDEIWPEGLLELLAPPQRPAIRADAAEIEQLMKRSTREQFPRYYDERQTAAAVEHVASLDLVLIDDGTYFVHEAGGEIVACGGWSRRNRLYAGSGEAADDGRLLDPASEPARVRAMFVRGDWTRRGIGRAILRACEDAARAEGFTKVALMATLPGEPLYAAYGFREVERTEVVTPGGVILAGVAMEKDL